jgi:hypothetical protein
MERSEQETELERLNELYWDTIDKLGEITMQRAALMNEMKETRDGTRT